MLPVRNCIPRVVGKLLRQQPMSDAKVRFAWTASVGAPMAHATSVALDPQGTLHVAADTEHWRREAVRSSAVIRRRLDELLGPRVVHRLQVRMNRRG